jgi:hypothetical protein
VGAGLSNGYAVNEKERGPFVFRAADGSLKEHKITKGRRGGEKVESVATFTGSAFQVEGGAEPLLVLGEPSRCG